MQKPYILGINFGGHDTSAALMAGGQLVAACAQERYDLVKHSREFPRDAIQDCLSIASINIDQVDLVAYSNVNKHLIRVRYLRPALTSVSRLNFLFNHVGLLPLKRLTWNYPPYNLPLRRHSRPVFIRTSA